MITPDEFLRRVLAALDNAAFLLANTPHECQEEWINAFGDRIRPQWREALAPPLSNEDVDGMVADAVARLRAKRDNLERFGTGTA
jgi:hypothetical protein